MKPYFRRGITPTSSFQLEEAYVPKNLEQAYALIRTYTEENPGFPAAWKLGGTTPATQQVFDAKRVYFGAMHSSEVLHRPFYAPELDLCELKVEAEIALRISHTANKIMSKGPSAILDANAIDLFDAWCWALELPSSPIENLLECGLRALVADRCAAGALVLGECQTMHQKPWRGGKLQLLENGKPLCDGGVQALTDQPEECARDFLVEASKLSYCPRGGQWISTGGLTPCMPINEEALIELFHDDERVLSFTSKRKTS